SDRSRIHAQHHFGSGRCARAGRRSVCDVVSRLRYGFIDMKKWIPSRRVPNARVLAIAPPFVWLALVLLLPFLLVLKISFADLKFGVPPYTALAQLQDQALTLVLNLRGYASLFSDSLYIATYLNSVKMALVTTVCCV